MMTLPEGFVVRSPTMNDSAVVLALIQEKERSDYGEVSTTERALRNAWQAPGFNLSTDAWVVKAQDGEIIGYARVWHYEYIHIYLHVVVLPIAHEADIKVFLLSLAERRAHEYAALASGKSSVALRTVTTDNNYADQDILVHAGYHKLRSRCRMEMPLSEARSPAIWPVEITVRSCLPEQDMPDIFATQEEAFAHPAGYPQLTFEQWRRLTVPEEGFDPSLWFIAEEGMTMVGICLCTASGSVGAVGTLAFKDMLQPGFQFRINDIKMFRYDLYVGDNGHKIGVALPARDDVVVDMLCKACACDLSLVDTHVKPLGTHLLA